MCGRADKKIRQTCRGQFESERVSPVKWVSAEAVDCTKGIDLALLPKYSLFTISRRKEAKEYASFPQNVPRLTKWSVEGKSSCGSATFSGKQRIRKNKTKKKPWHLPHKRRHKRPFLSLALLWVKSKGMSLSSLQLCPGFHVDWRYEVMP